MSPRASDFREPSRAQTHLTHHTRGWHAQAEPDSQDGLTIDVHRRVGGAPLLLCLHGFPTSSFDWRFVLIQDRQRAAVTFDYPGLGGSEKPPDAEYSVERVADLAERLVEEHGQGRSVLIVAHDLGLSVAAELIARQLEDKLSIDLAGAVLLNGVIVPGETQREFARKLVSGAGRFGGERRFRRQLARGFSPQHPLTDEEAADQWSLMIHNDGNKLGDRLLAYLDVTPEWGERAQTAVRDWSRPISAVWGMRDPVSGPAELDALRALRPAIDVTELADVGHFPQVEDAEQVYTAIKEWVAAFAHRTPGTGAT